MKRFLNKILSMKVPDEWCDPDSFAMNIAQFVFWVGVLGTIFFLGWVFS